MGRGAERVEIDRTEGVRTVPATRMKAKREHRVPLCRRAIDVLDGGGRTLGGGKPLYDRQLRWLLRKLQIAAMPHSFRSSFRDWTAEETNHPREVIETVLAHVVRNRVEAAYRWTDLLERRRGLMDDWASYLAGENRDPEAVRGLRKTALAHALTRASKGARSRDRLSPP